MRINTNVSALNAQRQLGITNTAVSQSITRLSSGFRINRAADDAAGLGIANKLRGDIRSMTQAARNGEQANSLAQIAEGSVSGIAKMLDRMKELATQANSDTVDTAGRTRLQAEWDALVSEIDRTAETTQFGSTKLINGKMGNTIGVAGTPADDYTTVAGTRVEISGVAAGTYDIAEAGGNITISFGGKTQELAATAGTTLDFDVFGIKLSLDANHVANSLNGKEIEIDAPVGGTAGKFMVGSSGDYADKDLLSFSNINMTTGSTALNLETLSLASNASAQTALLRVDTAVGKVNEALGKIGAFQNRIENAVANLKTSIENLSASESVIRDLDMASEMTTFSKNQILAQAGTAMLAQANQSSQNILQLLRG